VSRPPENTGATAGAGGRSRRAWLHPLAALAAGGLTVFSLAPVGLWPLQILCVGVLAALLGPTMRHRRAFLLGWCYAFASTTAATYWLYTSLHTFGGMAAPIAAAAVLVLAAAMAIYGGLAAAGLSWLAQRIDAGRGLKLLVLFPACWMLQEWLRGWLFTGFPWASSGYAHASGALSGYAAIIGVYGLGGLAAMLGACLALLRRTKLPALLVLAVLLAGFGLRQIEWTEAHGKPVTVRLLQGNVPQEMKFAPEQVQATLTLYENMIRSASADLIATPETALPLLLQQLPEDYLPRLQDYAEESGSNILVGVPVSDSPREYANSILGMRPSGRAFDDKPGDGARSLYRYDKHHLVPFGEFIPTGARWFVNLMSIPLGDFTRGALLQAPFAVRDQLVMPNICYEDLFGEEIADQIAAPYLAGTPQPTILLNVSNIAWFGDSIALPQHLQISQMRTLETGRPMLRATNTGATAIIDGHGRIVSQLKPYTRGTLAAEVQGMSGWTPYILMGNTLPVGAACAVLAALWLLRRGRARG
jgi:apolipoprotein N-acyltransferase